MDVCNRKLITFAVALSFYSSVFGQDKNQKRTDQFVILSKGTVRLDSLLKKVTQQTGFIFSYNTRKLNHNLSLNLTQANYSLDEILLKVKEKTGLDYSIAENHIILKTGKPRSLQLAPLRTPSQGGKEQKKVTEVPLKKSEPKVKTDSAKAIQNTKKLESSTKSFPKKDSIQKKNGEPTIAKKAPLKTDSLENKVTSNQSGLPQKKIITKETIKNEKDSLKRNPISAQDANKDLNKPQKPKKVGGNQPFLVRAGISADETLYLGPTIQLGIPILFATVSYKTDFNLNLINYGIGTSFKLGNNMSVSLFANMGDVLMRYDTVRYFVVDSIRTPYSYSVHAKSTLSRFGVVLEKKLNSRISIQAGIQYNSLATKYIVNGYPKGIGYLGPEADKKIHTIVPPYLLTNSYSPTSDSNVKSWIGIQLNLLYIIDFSRKR